MKNSTGKSKRNLSGFFILSFFLLGIINANSQTVFYDSISKKKYAKIDVRQTYERVIQKGYESIEMLEYLGNYYYKDKDFQKSKLYFDMLFRKYKLAQISPKSIELYNKLPNWHYRNDKQKNRLKYNLGRFFCLEFLKSQLDVQPQFENWSKP